MLHRAPRPVPARPRARRLPRPPGDRPRGRRHGRSDDPVHGKASLVYHEGRGILAGVASPVRGGSIPLAGGRCATTCPPTRAHGVDRGRLVMGTQLASCPVSASSSTPRASSRPRAPGSSRTSSRSRARARAAGAVGERRRAVATWHAGRVHGLERARGHLLQLVEQALVHADRPCPGSTSRSVVGHDQAVRLNARRITLASAAKPSSGSPPLQPEARAHRRARRRPRRGE